MWAAGSGGGCSPTRLDTVAAEKPPPRVLASLNLARALTKARQSTEALTLFTCENLTADSRALLISSDNLITDLRCSGVGNPLTC